MAIDTNRCAICGWTLADSPESGCVRANCSMRPLPRRFFDPERVKAEYGLWAPREDDPYVPPPPTAGDLLIRAVDRWLSHVAECEHEDCDTCVVGINQVRLAYKVWQSSAHQAAGTL